MHMGLNGSSSKVIGVQLDEVGIKNSGWHQNIRGLILKAQT